MSTLNSILMATVLLAASGCTSVRNVERVNTEKLNAEGSLVFVRPRHYSIFGTRSLADYVEVIYERVTKVQTTGNMRVQVGIRNRGGQRWYSTKAPDITIGAQISFYQTPNIESSPIYQSNRRSVLLQRGETVHLEFDCPAPGALSYQIVFSDF